jgi:6-pyruvoyltetrahydropterin/6-carboxytetrahydropterin synthase
MYNLTIRSGFSAAHKLINYQGNCENLHGHNWKVEVSVLASELDEAGIGLDFKTLKRQAGSVIEELDHSYLNEISAFSGRSPSSEHIARYLYQKIGESLNSEAVKIDSVTVWESENASARYFE